MSAINGIFERRGTTFPEAAFFASPEALANYGFEGSDQWFSPFVGFGHQNSSILPEDANEKFPVDDAAARLVITADARIDNRAELFDALHIPQNERKILSDSRLILRAWQKWKRDCPYHLIGDYAFCRLGRATANAFLRPRPHRRETVLLQLIAGSFRLCRRY